MPRAHGQVARCMEKIVREEVALVFSQFPLCRVAGRLVEK
jgi:hypothetical protein